MQCDSLKYPSVQRDNETYAIKSITLKWSINLAQMTLPRNRRSFRQIYWASAYMFFQCSQK